MTVRSGNPPPDDPDEDELDLQENLRRSRGETVRTDLLFLAVTVLLCLLLALGVLLVVVVF